MPWWITGDSALIAGIVVSEHRERADRLFGTLRTPIDTRAEGIGNYDVVLYKMVGAFCMMYGFSSCFSC